MVFSTIQTLETILLKYKLSTVEMKIRSAMLSFRKEMLKKRKKLFLRKGIKIELELYRDIFLDSVLSMYLYVYVCMYVCVCMYYVCMCAFMYVYIQHFKCLIWQWGKMGFLCVAVSVWELSEDQAGLGLELTEILLPLPPEYWD